MNEKRNSWRGYALFALLLILADLAVLRAVRPQPVESRGVVIQEGPELAAYRSFVARQMRLVTRSGCFDRCDPCLQYVRQVITHTEDGLTVEEYRGYVLDRLEALWEIECIHHVVGCKNEVYGVLR
jgi:hypothetical protein